MAAPSSQSLGDEPKPEIPQPELSSDSASEELTAPEPEAFKPGWRFMAAFGSLCIITLMAALDATSISVALPVSLSVNCASLC
jgi:hypothetical protein